MCGKQVLPYSDFEKLKEENEALRRRILELEVSVRILREVALACWKIIPSKRHNFVMESFIKSGGPEKVKL